jgi:DNA polymerase-3 subunit alpha
MNSLALTDHGNLHGALEFYRKAKAADINPIIGYEAYIAPGSRFQKDGGRMKDSSYHLTLLAKNRTGFRNLVKMASKAYLEGFYFKPRIDKALLEEFNEGIVCLSGCVSGELSRTLLKGGMQSDAELAESMEIAGWFHKLFGDRYFIEIQNNGVDIQRMAMEGSVRIAERLGLPLVCTSDAHYADREDAEAQDVMLCINTGKFRTDSSRMRMEGDEFFIRTPEEMYEAFPDHADAVQRSQESNRRRVSTGDLRSRTQRAIRRQRGDASKRRVVTGRLGSTRPRTRRDQQAGIPELLSDCLGLRREISGDGNPGNRSWQWRRRVGLLRVVYESCLSH